MESLELIRMQISLEYQVDQDGLLVPFPGSSEQAWYVVYQHLQGYMTYFNRAIPNQVRQELIALGAPAAFNRRDQVIKLIEDASCHCTGGEDIYWSGYFPLKPHRVDYPGAARDGEAWVRVEAGEVVARAISVRQNDQCAEAYVETSPNFRRKGYGKQVVTAWAKQVMDSGRVALYSYHQMNRASAALASSLGVVWYANVVTFGPET